MGRRGHQQGYPDAVVRRRPLLPVVLVSPRFFRG